MKALTLTQPWATLVAIGAKRIETRSWHTFYRGPLAIHAAKGFPKDARDFAGCRMVNHFLVEAGFPTADKNAGLSIGCVVATCNVVECLPTESTGCLPGVFEDYPQLDTPQERAFGNYDPGRWGWVLEDVIILPMPIPAKGKLSLWDWESVLERAKEAL